MNFFKKIVKYVVYFFGYKLSHVGVRYFYMQRLFDRASGLKGDIVECGVGNMHTFNALATFLRDADLPKKLWGFDSFEGFPYPSLYDQSPRNAKKGELKYIEAEDVAKILVVLGFKNYWIDSHIKIIKGFFQDTLPSCGISEISFLHLDVDLYNSYKICLEQLFPKVVKGGVVLFDEYDNGNENYKFPGAKKAIDEYFRDTKYKLSRDKLTGKYFLIKS
ncbi:MAG: TylF/MycF/NovP-related O-methyltransferase [Patescibacteria group bacterium]